MSSKLVHSYTIWDGLSYSTVDINLLFVIKMELIPRRVVVSGDRMSTDSKRKEVPKSIDGWNGNDDNYILLQKGNKLDSS